MRLSFAEASRGGQVVVLGEQKGAGYPWSVVCEVWLSCQGDGCPDILSVGYWADLKYWEGADGV